MNSSQIHLALTHVPVILSLVGLTILIIALVRKNDTLTKTSFYILLTAGLFALPVYFTGEGAEEVVEDLPGVSEGIIGKHEQFASISLTIILICGALSLAALFLYKSFSVARVMKYVVLLFAFASAVTMARTAHLGGQIRHTEIQSTVMATSNEQENGENAKQEKGSTQNEGKDDDD
ncbi:MAG TPA: hypothetical protein VNT20_14945 [Flavisolibacter sp.]|jgi:uncharacterized membrane protein|nr:hypothetical protein [Flavisolibacter sp.]